MQKEIYEKISKETWEKIIEFKNCEYCLQDYPLYESEKKAYDKEEFIYSKICPDCTFRVCNYFLNDKYLYKRKCDKTKKDMVSIYAPGSQLKIFESDIYKKMMSEDYWLTYSKDINDDITLDFKNLFLEFPKQSRDIHSWLENALYSSHTWWAKNVYLSYWVFVDCEDIYYSFSVWRWCKNVFNSYKVSWSNNIYYSSLITKSYEIIYSHNIINSNFLFFCENITNCSNCIFCCNLANKDYCIFNKQYSKEKYLVIEKKIRSEIKDYDRFLYYKDLYNDFLERESINEACIINNSEKACWDNIFDSTNLSNCFYLYWTSDSCNCMNCSTFEWIKNTNLFNLIEAWPAENCIWVVSVWWWDSPSTNIYFSQYCSWASSKLYYCFDIVSCKECIFCIWLRNKEFCILNKQYTKEDYFIKKEKIKNDLIKIWKWWDFIWFDFIKFPYNDTLAYDYFKINKIIFPDWEEQIIDKNSYWTVEILSDDFISDATIDFWSWKKHNIKWRTKDREINIPSQAETINAKDLPNTFEVDEDILKKVIICEKSQRPFKIMPLELEFIKKRNLPIPRIHYELRTEELLKKRPIWKLHLRKSSKDWEEILSVFDKDFSWKVYSNEEYREYMFK